MKLRHFFFAALASVMAFAACEQGIDPVNPDTKPEVYTVKLACTGELDITQVPLTRFTPDNNDLYAVQVDYKPNSGGSYKAYAYGLFDDVSNLTVELLADYKYRFAIEMIDDAKDIVYCDSVLIDTQHYLGYGAPFEAYNRYNASNALSITKVMNELVYDDNCYFSNVGGLQHNGYTSASKVKLNNGEEYADPKNVDRYYGLVEDYSPSSEGEEISVFMKRMVFGLKVVAGDFLTEGTVTMTYDGYHYNDILTLTPDNKEYEAVYSYWIPYSWYKAETPSASQFISFKWTKNDGTSLSLRQQSITFNRLKQTVVNVVFYEDENSGDATLSMLYDDDPFTEGKSYLFGDDQGEYAW